MGFMGNIFLKLFSMSLSAGVLVLAVLLFRGIFTRAPKKLRRILWAVVAFRLVCPFTILTSFGVLPENNFIRKEFSSAWTPLLQRLVKEERVSERHAIFSTYKMGRVNNAFFSAKDVPIPDTGIEALDKAVLDVLEKTVAYKIEDIWFFASVAWVVGMAGMLLYAVIGALLLNIRLAEAIPANEGDGKRIYVSEKISSPFVFGVFYPKIYLPVGLSEEQKPHILRHEEMHCKNKDYLWKLFGFVLLSVYWFCPLIWVAYALFCRDMEYACDEAVIAGLAKEEREGYAQTLLSCSSIKSSVYCPVYFAETGVTARLRHVVTYKESPVFLTVGTILASILFALCFLTSGRNLSEKKFLPQYYFRTKADYTNDALVEKYLQSIPAELGKADFLRKIGVMVDPVSWKKLSYADMDIWDNFVRKVERGENALLMIARYGNEGAAELQYIYYDGKQFYYRKDNSRDTWSSPRGTSASRSFQYMKSEDVTWDDGVTRKEIILTNSPKATPAFPDLGNSSVTGTSVHVASFVSDPLEPCLDIGGR